MDANQHTNIGTGSATVAALDSADEVTKLASVDHACATGANRPVPYYVGNLSPLGERRTTTADPAANNVRSAGRPKSAFDYVVELAVAAERIVHPAALHDVAEATIA